MNKKEMIKRLQKLYRDNPGLSVEEAKTILEVLGFLGGESATYFFNKLA